MIRSRFFALTALLGAAAVLQTSPIARAQTSASIVDVAAADPQFSTLVAAVKAAGLADTLASPGPFTVFAPTNAAFAKLPKGTVDSLLRPENVAKLKAILLYHVVPGKVTASEIKPGAVATAGGGTLDVRVDGKTVRVNDATVVKADVAASNGVIHVIDTVLLPK